MPDRSDLELASRLEAEARNLVGLFLAWTGDRNVADDLFQETCLEVWRSRSRFRPDADFGAWARGIARNVVLRHGRNARRNRSAPLTSEVMDLLASSWEAAGEAPPEAEERKSALRECLGALEDGQRAVLARRYEDGWSHERIAAGDGRSPDAVKMVLARLRSKLHACVERRLARGRAHG